MATSWVQLKWLFNRSWILAKREPRLGQAKIIQTIVVSLFMVTVFAGLGIPVNIISNTTISSLGEDSASLSGAIYFMTVLQMFLNFLPTVIVFQGEKPIYVRERDGGLYDIWVYATTKMIAEQPIMFIVPLVMTMILYWAVRFEDRLTTFFSFYFILMLMVQAASSLGYFLSSMMNSETAAVAFTPIINLPLNLLGGFMISLINIF
jgi:ABC-type multidrug transport system permease subunit